MQMLLRNLQQRTSALPRILSSPLPMSSRSPQQKGRRLSLAAAPRQELPAAPLLRPTTSASRTPPTPTPPHSISSVRTTGLSPIRCRSSSATSNNTTSLLASPRANSTTISSSRAAQIARHLSGFTANMSSYTVRKIAAAHTFEHRVYIEKDGVPVSPFHDIPLYANAEQTILNMVVEIPRWTNAKLEVRSRQGVIFSLLFFLQLIVMIPPTDLQGGTPQPHQAGHQEGQASIRPQLLPPQGLPVELRCLPPGTID